MSLVSVFQCQTFQSVYPCLGVCLYLSLCICFSVSVFVYLRLSVCLFCLFLSVSVSQWLFLSLCICVSLSFSVSVYMCLSVCLFLSLPCICVSVSIFFCLSVYLCLSVSDVLFCLCVSVSVSVVLCLCVYMSQCLSFSVSAVYLCHSFRLFLSGCLSMSQCIWCLFLSVYLCLSVCRFLSLCICISVGKKETKNKRTKNIKPYPRRTGTKSDSLFGGNPLGKVGGLRAQHNYEVFCVSRTCCFSVHEYDVRIKFCLKQLWSLADRGWQKDLERFWFWRQGRWWTSRHWSDATGDSAVTENDDDVDVEVLFYVHRSRRLIRDGSPGRPPRLWHRSWTLLMMLCWSPLESSILCPRADSLRYMND